MNTLIGFAFVIASIVMIILDIHSTWLCMQVPGTYERNEKFVDRKNNKILYGKMILYKSVWFAIVSAAALILYYFFDAGYFAFFVYIGMTFVHIPAVLNNYKLYKKNKHLAG